MFRQGRWFIYFNVACTGMDFISGYEQCCGSETFFSNLDFPSFGSGSSLTSKKFRIRP
jgi:hypothetical protein